MLATKQGTRIGSALSEVKKAFEDKEDTGKESLAAGFIRGGILFTIENEKVKEIFFGAAAE